MDNQLSPGRILIGLALVAAASALTACCGITAPDIPLLGSKTGQGTPTPQASPTPSATPEPSTALFPAHIWVAVEGLADSVLSVAPAGDMKVVRLPLNEGQQASDVTASGDASTLAYLVWDEEGSQHGIAAWNLEEANARLIAQPLPGYRITALYLTERANALAYVLVEEGALFSEADWRVESVSGPGGEPTLLASREAMPDSAPPALVAWPDGGSLWLDFTAPDGTSQGVYAVDPDTLECVRRIPVEDAAVEDRLVVGAALSPDGERLAYLTYEGEAPADPSATNVARVVDLTGGETITMTPPEGQAIYGLRWHPDAQRLLFDMVQSPLDEEGDTTQRWALAEVGQSPPWSGSALGPEREYLFDYRPYGDGVVFTVLPASEAWELYLITNLTGDGGLRTYSLAGIAQEFGAPKIIHVPLPASLP
jgi:hypothetical protein